MKNTRNKRDYTKTFETKKTTKERHSSMKVATRDIKIVSNSLSKKKKEHLNGIFREAKWFRNYCISDIKGCDTTAKSVLVKIGEVFEEKAFEFLSSQMKQGLKSSVKDSLVSLKTKKKNGERVGKLKFKSFCNSVPLNQYGSTFSIDFKKNRISLQGLKLSIYVRGLHQIPKDAEISNAKLVRQPDGFHLLVTYFYNPESLAKADKKIGIDLGIKDSVVTSDGKRYNIRVEESKGVKLASRRFNRSLCKAKKLGINETTRSSNHLKRKKKLQRAYQKVANKRQDLANKVVHDLLYENSFIAMQDELIKLWHKGWFGKQVQHSALGEVKARLKQSPKVVVIESDFLSTQICPHCEQRTKHSLEKRKFVCKHCGYTEDRDINAASNILKEALS